MASKDILQRLLELDPTRRLRSFRALETTAFFKDFNVKDILEKKVKPNDLLKLYFPNGPHNTESPSEENFENFDRFDVCDGS
ncbi:hypothetical protein NQ315_016675 [Exocentrus adspersus]|uniref:Uncharacterized protein n=1 Tax=Exocentrus adspersus TaxID=1586481 RepID=A0AAV8VPV2_9CUCU|nr:hypothetical protein NQ315_016675 [Exocentrus adspersus]